MPTKRGNSMALENYGSTPIDKEPAVEGVHWRQAPTKEGRQRFYCLIDNCTARETGYSVLTSLNRHLKPKHLMWVYPQNEAGDGLHGGPGVGLDEARRTKQTKEPTKRSGSAAAPRRPLHKRPKTGAGAAVRRRSRNDKAEEKEEVKEDAKAKADDNAKRAFGKRGNKQPKVDRPPTVPGAANLDEFAYGNDGQEVPRQAHYIKIPICNLNTVSYKSQASKGGCSQTFEASWNQFATATGEADGPTYASFPIFGKEAKVKLSKCWKRYPNDKENQGDFGDKTHGCKGTGPDCVDCHMLEMEDFTGGSGQVSLVNYSSDSDEEELELE